MKSLPADIVQDWLTPDGRVQSVRGLSAASDPNDNEVIPAHFARCRAGGAAERHWWASLDHWSSGNTAIVGAFIQAGIWAVMSIGDLLWIVLRRISDVLLTLIPLMVAGVVTLEITVLIGLPLNFANIIALPLLLGLGVAFKIYYIMAWRSGQTSLLQTSLNPRGDRQRPDDGDDGLRQAPYGCRSTPAPQAWANCCSLSLLCTLAADSCCFSPRLWGDPRTSR